MRRIAGLAIFLLAAGLLTGCEGIDHFHLVDDPTANDTISAFATAEVPPTHRDVAYRSCDTCERSHLDVYGATGPARGTIVFFHGGGFDGGAKELIFAMGMIKSQTERGWTVVTPNYYLAPADGTGSRTEMMTDAKAVINWLHSSEATNYGVPAAGPVIVGGHSAGGTIAGLLATSGVSTRIDGWVSISGILSWAGGPNSTAAADTLHGGGPRGAAPADRFDSSTPPGYLIHGDQDDVVESLNLVLAGLAAFENGPDLTFDLVDADAAGNGLGGWRGHVPSGGANAERFNDWLDSF